MVHWENVQKYAWYFLGVMGVVFFWVGVWDGIGNLGPLKNPWISLAAGLVMLILSKVFFRETDPAEEAQQAAKNSLLEIHQHPQRHEFQIQYHDKIQQQPRLIPVEKLHKIEKGFLVFLHEGRESFVPIQRVAEIHHLGVLHKKLNVTQ